MNAIVPAPAAPVVPPVVVPPVLPAPSLAGATPPVEPSKPDVVIPEPKPGEPPKPAEPPVEPPAAFAMDKIKLPEGMKADDALMTKYSGIMTNDKLSPAERGQQLIDLYAEGHKLARDAATVAWDTVQTQWQTETKADPTIGGAKWAGTQATIAKAIDTLGPEHAAAFRQALDITGAGNHPAVARALHAFAAKLTEGTHVGGTPPGGQPQTVKEAFYPNSPEMK